MSTNFDLLMFILLPAEFCMLLLRFNSIPTLHVLHLIPA